MAEQQDEATRRLAEAARSARRVMADADPTRVATQLSEVGTQTIGLWAELNQKVVRDLMDVSLNALRDNGRFLARWHESQIDTFCEAQSASWRWWLTLPQAYSDPLRWYQQTMEEMVSGVQRAARLGHQSIDGLGATVERLQGTAEEAARSLDGTFKEATSRMRELQARSEKR